MARRKLRFVPAPATPGSLIAQELGCTCSVARNNSGIGFEVVALHTSDRERQKRQYRQTEWVIDRACPVHSSPWAPFKAPSRNSSTADRLGR